MHHGVVLLGGGEAVLFCSSKERDGLDVVKDDGWRLVASGNYCRYPLPYR